MKRFLGFPYVGWFWTNKEDSSCHAQDYSELRVGWCLGKIVLSYAKLQISDFSKTRKMSLIKILKSKGPNIEP